MENYNENCEPKKREVKEARLSKKCVNAKQWKAFLYYNDFVND